MASLKKPVICGYCESTDFIHKYDPERWECIGCGKVIAQRPQRISGICRKCGASEKDKPFKKGKNLCLECDNKYMVEWRKKNPGWNDSPEFKKKRFASVRRAIQKSPESFLKHLYLCLTRPSRKEHMRNSQRYDPKRLAMLNHVTITLDFLLALYEAQEGRCAITGMEMYHFFGDPCTISIDRIDAGRSYTHDNVHLVCQWVNLAKSKHSVSLFRTVLGELLKVNKTENFILRAGHTHLCGECLNEFDDGLSYRDVKEGENPPQCSSCGADLCPRCVGDHQCDPDYLDDDDD